MAQIAGFDSSFVPNAPTEGLRQAESAPDSARVTPPADSDAQRPDRQQTAPEDSAEFDGRVGFTTKFGPDETGFPLQLVRGEDFQNAVTSNLAALQEARQTQASRGALIRAQESEQRLAERRSENSAAQTQTISAPAPPTADTSASDTGGQTTAPEAPPAPTAPPPAQTAPTVQTGGDTGGATTTESAPTQSAPAFTPASVASSGGQTESSGGGAATDSARGGGVDVQV